MPYEITELRIFFYSYVRDKRIAIISIAITVTITMVKNKESGTKILY